MKKNKKVWIANPSNLCPVPNNNKVSEYVNIIYKNITNGKQPSVNKLPQLIIPIGTPSSGKSTILEYLVKEHSDIDFKDYVYFDTDKLLDYLPIGENIQNIPDINGNKTGIGYAFGWSECMDKLSRTQIVPLLINKILRSNYNFILNTHYFNVIIDAQLNGYFCILVYVLVTKKIAKERATNRAQELGRFFSLNYNNAFGWSESIQYYLKTYKEQAVWYSLWADRLVIVKNNKNNTFPKKNDFKIIITHPNGHSKKNNWKIHIKKIYNMIETLSFEKRKEAKKSS